MPSYAIILGGATHSWAGEGDSAEIVKVARLYSGQTLDSPLATINFLFHNRLSTEIPILSSVLRRSGRVHISMSEPSYWTLDRIEKTGLKPL